MRRAQNADPEKALEDTPQRTETFSVTNVDLFLDALTRRADLDEYTLELDRRTKRQLVFGDKPDALSFGFFYPVTWTTIDTDGVVVTVGITPRAMKMEFIATRNYPACPGAHH